MKRPSPAASTSVLVDTAGACTPAKLMEGAPEVVRVIGRRFPMPSRVWLCFDATTGQNAVNQAKVSRSARRDRDRAHQARRHAKGARCWRARRARRAGSCRRRREPSIPAAVLRRSTPAGCPGIAFVTLHHGGRMLRRPTKRKWGRMEAAQANPRTDRSYRIQLPIRFPEVRSRCEVPGSTISQPLQVHVKDHHSVGLLKLVGQRRRCWITSEEDFSATKTLIERLGLRR